MPNHITNILRVSGDPEKVRAMFEAIKDDKIGLGILDFNKVIPMPAHIFRGNLGMAEREKYGKENWYDWSISIGEPSGTATVIVAAITSSHKKPLPTHVTIRGVHSLSQESLALLEQIRTIDRSRLQEWIGSLDSETLGEVDEALKISVGLGPAYFNFTERISAL